MVSRRVFARKVRRPPPERAAGAANTIFLAPLFCCCAEFFFSLSMDGPAIMSFLITEPEAAAAAS